MIGVHGFSPAAEFLADHRQLLCQPGEPEVFHWVYIANEPCQAWITAQALVKNDLYSCSKQCKLPAYPEGSPTNPALEAILRSYPVMSFINPGLSLGVLQSWIEHEFGIVFHQYGEGVLALSPILEITQSNGQFTIRPESAALGKAILDALKDHPPTPENDRHRHYFDLGVLLTTLRDYLQINWQPTEILRVLGRIVALCDRLDLPSGNLQPLYTELLRNSPLAALPPAFSDRVEASLQTLEQVIAP
jgi:hypothetical protein